MAKVKSIQKQIGKVRPPRVQLTYDVETGGEVKQKTLPFVVGVIADLGAGGKSEQVPLRGRSFADINGDNFNAVMAAMAPALSLSVPNKLGGEVDRLDVNLEFTSMEGFTPESIAQRVPAIAKLFEARKKLNDLQVKLDGNDRLNDLLLEVVNNDLVKAKVHSELAGQRDESVKSSD